MRTNNSWFTLARHDDPPADPPPADPPAPEPPDDPSDMDDNPDPGDKGKPADKDPAAELAKWKALARKHEGNAKANKSAADELAQIKASQQTETEKLAAAKEAAEAKADAAITRAVKAEIKVLASAADFADPRDAEGAINPRDFVDDKGEIDIDGIKARLAEILDDRPHWRKQTAAIPPVKPPKPDPGQGARPPAPPTNFKTASLDEVNAELAKYGQKTRQ